MIITLKSDSTNAPTVLQNCARDATMLKMNIISWPWGNIVTMLLQHCHNVRKLCNYKTMPLNCYNIENDVILQRSHNIQAMLSERWMNVGAQHWNPTELHHSDKIAITLWQHWNLHNFQCCHNVVTRLRECCVNVVGQPKHQRSH